MSCIQNTKSGKVFTDVEWPFYRYTLEPPVHMWCKIWIGSLVCEVCVLTSLLSRNVILFR
jgi:hypothetical protein